MSNHCTLTSSVERSKAPSLHGRNFTMSLRVRGSRRVGTADAPKRSFCQSGSSSGMPAVVSRASGL
eukprot:1235115-Alexandrium_andersonii.AAC.1